MLEDLVPMEPLHFFDVEIDVGKESTLLPDLLESRLARVYCSWSTFALHFTFEISRLFDQPGRQGDCIELFIDTRGVKSSTLTRFCHHFLIFPERVDGEIAAEITRFRTEERHPLADPKLIEVKSHMEKRKRKIEISLPQEVLYGYDPTEHKKLGLNFRVLGVDGKMQILSASSEDFPIEQHPLLWASIHLES